VQLEILENKAILEPQGLQVLKEQTEQLDHKDLTAKQALMDQPETLVQVDPMVLPDPKVRGVITEKQARMVLLVPQVRQEQMEKLVSLVQQEQKVYTVPRVLKAIMVLLVQQALEEKPVRKETMELLVTQERMVRKVQLVQLVQQEKLVLKDLLVPLENRVLLVRQVPMGQLVPLALPAIKDQLVRLVRKDSKAQPAKPGFRAQQVKTDNLVQMVVLDPMARLEK